MMPGGGSSASKGGELKRAASTVSYMDRCTYMIYCVYYGKRVLKWLLLLHPFPFENYVWTEKFFLNIMMPCSIKLKVGRDVIGSNYVHICIGVSTLDVLIWQLMSWNKEWNVLYTSGCDYTFTFEIIWALWCFKVWFINCICPKPVTFDMLLTQKNIHKYLKMPIEGGLDIIHGHIN